MVCKGPLLILCERIDIETTLTKKRQQIVNLDCVLARMDIKMTIGKAEALKSLQVLADGHWSIQYAKNKTGISPPVGED